MCNFLFILQKIRMKKALFLFIVMFGMLAEVLAQLNYNI